MVFYKVSLQMKKERELLNDYTITTPKDIVKFLNQIEEYDLSANKRVVVVALSTKNHIVAYSEIAVGDIDKCNIDIPSIFKFMLTTPANKFIIAHNNPSGDSTPSETDIKVTDRIKQASEIIGMKFLDHIIIGQNEYTSVFEYTEKGGK